MVQKSLIVTILEVGVVETTEYLSASTHMSDQHYIVDGGPVYGPLGCLGVYVNIKVSNNGPDTATNVTVVRKEPATLSSIQC